MALRELFTRHPASVGETYGEHMGVALSFAGPLALAAMAALVHAFLPWCFERTASGIVTRLHDRMVTNRTRQTPAAETRLGAARTQA